jgi:hypothetical protein
MSSWIVAGLTKMCLNEVCVGKDMCDAFSVHNGLKQDAALPLL